MQATEDFEVPPWLNLPKSFYDSLNEIAEVFGVPRRQVLTRGVALFREREQALRSGVKGPVLPGVGEISPEQAREFHSILGSYFTSQRKTTAAQLRKNAQKAAQARWQKPPGSSEI